MYCKKCGRKLEDGMRYCDRCGQSVRQSENTGKEARKKEIEELKKERINRKQQLQEAEQLKKEKKEANKKQTNILTLIFIILFCILVVAIVTFTVVTKKSENALWRTRDGSVNLNATDLPSSTPAPTDKNGAKVTPVPTPTAYAVTGEINTDGYREFAVKDNILFAYPATFEQRKAESGEKLNLYDNNGGASILLRDEMAGTEQAKTLMSEYAKAQPVKPSYSRAGNNWYVVETTENDIIHHRKCLIVNGYAIYYDFSYSKTSSSASVYERQIEYMDSHFSLQSEK